MNKEVIVSIKKAGSIRPENWASGLLVEVTTSTGRVLHVEDWSEGWESLTDLSVGMSLSDPHAAYWGIGEV
jgi:hypothetical protein